MDAEKLTVRITVRYPRLFTLAGYLQFFGGLLGGKLIQWMIVKSIKVG